MRERLSSGSLSKWPILTKPKPTAKVLGVQALGPLSSAFLGTLARSQIGIGTGKSNQLSNIRLPVSQAVE